MKGYANLFPAAIRRRMPCLLFCMGLLGSVHAQPPAALPGTLENIKPAGECRRETERLSKANVPAKVDTPKPDMSCAIASAELARLLKSKATVLADVRPAAEFAAFHIDGAMNTTASALRTMDVMRGKTVVLIGNGKAEREQYTACARLKSNGFRQAKVLRGGMSEWLLSGQPVQGRPPDAWKSAQLTSAELWIESRFDANLVLVAARQDGIRRLLPSAGPVSDIGPVAIKKAVDHRKGRPLAAVVLVAPQSDKPEAFAEMRQAISPVPLLAYTGTAADYTKQEARQKAVWAAHEQGPRQPGCSR